MKRVLFIRKNFISKFSTSISNELKSLVLSDSNTTALTNEISNNYPSPYSPTSIIEQEKKKLNIKIN